MTDQYAVLTEQQVHVKVSSNAASFQTERRVEKSMTIGDLKFKLELQTGCSAATMKLEVLNKDDILVCKLDDDNAQFGSYPVDDGMRIHVTDPTKKLGEYEDISKVEKFELSEEEYNKRADSVRAFKQRMKIGRFADADPEEAARKEEEQRLKEEAEKAQAERINVGDRCQVHVQGTPTRRATVMYVGETDFKPGLWVGVRYDEPFGKNDGSVQGRRYFDCPPKYGGFIKPENIEVGDFPEEGFEDDELEL